MRRQRLSQRQLCHGLVMASLIGAAILAWEPLVPGKLILNVTASIPKGLYWMQPQFFYSRGTQVSYPLPRRLQRLAVARGYMPSMSTTTLKRIAATGGDHVCVGENSFSINGRRAGRVLRRDTAGRALPHTALCRTLKAGEVFLLNSTPGSFDSRYYGAVPAHRIEGRVNALLTATSFAGS